MKKIFQILIITFVIMIGINNVDATELGESKKHQSSTIKGQNSITSIEEYGVYCGYQNTEGESYYFLWNVNNDFSTVEVDTNFDSLGIAIEDGRPSLGGETTMQSPEMLSWFENKGLLVIPDGKKFYYWNCPSNPFGAQNLTFVEQGCHHSNCSTTLIPSREDLYDSYTCEYKNSKDNKKIIISYEENDTYPFGKWEITYPDLTTETIAQSNTVHFFTGLSDKRCADIYYVTTDKSIHGSVQTSDNISNNKTFSDLCDSYSLSEIEHYCQGECEYPEMVCSLDDYKTVSCGTTTGIPAALPKFIRNIINIIKIAVPVILIIMGMLDLAKAVTSNDEKGMKEAQGKFVKRIIGSIALFLIVTITQFIFNVIGTDDTRAMSSCINCFLNNNCSLITTATNVSGTIDICKKEADAMCDKHCYSMDPNKSSPYGACMTACVKQNYKACENNK